MFIGFLGLLWLRGECVSREGTDKYLESEKPEAKSQFLGDSFERVATGAVNDIANICAVGGPWSAHRQGSCRAREVLKAPESSPDSTRQRFGEPGIPGQHCRRKSARQSLVQRACKNPLASRNR